jgi:hypothetical protein
MSSYPELDFVVDGAVVHLTLEDAVASGLNLIGRTLGLAPMTWRPDEQGDLSIEGVPTGANPVKICEAWADALNMVEHHSDEEIRTWYCSQGAWWIEISTDRRTTYLRPFVQIV